MHYARLDTLFQGQEFFFSQNKVHIENLYWNISKGIKAMTRSIDMEAITSKGSVKYQACVVSRI